MGSSRGFTSKFDPIVQRAREPVFWVDSERKLLGVNRAWEALTGYQSTQVLGLSCLSAGQVVADGPASVVASFHVPNEAVLGRSTSTKCLILDARGEQVWARIDFFPLHGPHGKLAAIIGCVRTLTDSSNFEDALSDRLRVALLEVRERLIDRPGCDQVLGKGASHRRLLDQIETAASSIVPILITGDAGTGKRLVARTIRQLSKDKSGPLITIDCEALPLDVLGRTLFALPVNESEPQASRFPFPDHATLIVGDILSLPRDFQKRLAIAMESRIRVIATTRFDPEAALRDDRLLDDLYYRVSALVIRLPPLKERLDELLIFAQAFLEQANQRSSRTLTGFSETAMETLMAYDWPGNLQELSRVIDAAAKAADGERIQLEDLPAEIQRDQGSAYLPPKLAPPSTPLDQILDQVERRLIETAMSRCGRNKSKAAEALGISRARLHRRLSELNLADDDREPAG